MNNSVFREKSIQRVASPEQLGDYIRVSNPSVWIALLAVVVLLAGVCVWGIFGRLETKVEAPAVVSGGKAAVYITEAEAETVKAGMSVSIDGKSCKILAVSAVPTEVTKAFDSYAMHIGGFEIGDWVYEASAESTAADGIYPVQIVTDSVPPMSFVFN